MLRFRDKPSSGHPDKGHNKDFQRLNRHDLLELLVGQLHEDDQLHATIQRRERKIEDLNSLVERLKGKLDLKDEQIESLKEKLDLKDEQIERLKGKLDDKDLQMERLKSKLNEKDVVINRLKKRLDAKDRLIARVIDNKNLDKSYIELFEARQRAQENDGGDQ